MLFTQQIKKKVALIKETPKVTSEAIQATDIIEQTIQKGDTLMLDITLCDALNCNGTLDIFLEKLTKKIGGSKTDVVFEAQEIRFQVTRKNDKCIIKIADENEHMIDFVTDIFNGNVYISPFHITMSVEKVLKNKLGK